MLTLTTEQIEAREQTADREQRQMMTEFLTGLWRCTEAEMWARIDQNKKQAPYA